MQYLYGDSSPSPITVDYIGFLRAAIDAMVELMLAEQRIEETAAAAERLEEKAAGRLEAIGEVGQAVRAALEVWCRDPEDSPASRCANAIERSATAEVRAHSQAVTEELERAQREVIEARASELERCERALERLLAGYDLPESRSEHRLDGSEGAYAASRRDLTPYGVELALAIEIPEGTLLAGPLRGADLGLDKDLEVPEAAGLSRKLVRKLPRKLAKLVLTEARLGEASTLVLQTGSGPADPGLEIAIDSAGGAQVTPIGVAELEGVSFAADESNAVSLLGAADRLGQALEELGRERASLVGLRIDDEDFGDAKPPALLVERLIGAIAPVVADISERSSSPTELVLRKSLGGGRREEIFVTKSELAGKLEELPAPLRKVFGPLRLGAASRPPSELEVEMVVEDSAEEISVQSGELEALPPPIPGAVSDEASGAAEKSGSI